MGRFFDTDRFKEILDTLSRNRGRTLLTGFGVFWGIFMLILLVGGGKGVKQLVAGSLNSFSSNAAMVWTDRTSKPYKGLGKGRWWNMSMGDIDRLAALVPELDVISPQSFGWDRPVATYEERTSSINIRGQRADYARIEAPTIRYGRFISEMDVAQARKVCVIGKQVWQNLFPGGNDPTGKRIRIGASYYTVIGVDYNDHSVVNINGRGDEAVVIPITTVQRLYNKGDAVDVIAVTAREGVVMSDILPKIRAAVASGHQVDPTDEKAVPILNTEMFFAMIDSLFKGVNILIWLIGIGTLLAGVIGVSNIMMVTVRERTTEIGIRRAIGATPRMILSQIMTESLVMTLVAGAAGLVLAVVILDGLELANTTDGILKAHFQVGFWTAVGAVLLLSVLGVAAGLAPAARAMKIKPVDAMRDE